MNECTTSSSYLFLSIWGNVLYCKVTKPGPSRNGVQHSNDEELRSKKNYKWKSEATLSSIQPFVVPWVHHTLVSNEHSTRPTCTCFHTSLYILRLSFQFAYLFVEPFICIIQPSVARSTVPLVVLPSISPNTTSFTSLLNYTL